MTVYKRVYLCDKCVYAIHTILNLLNILYTLYTLPSDSFRNTVEACCIRVDYGAVTIQKREGQGIKPSRLL